ncbi:MAG TPA: Nramp family divalent metal transporter [Candidatus Acidoferrales bacterium]|nr:Nramp family divalent metal transporter [Candidatus Acidoferrales bacterium]
MNWTSISERMKVRRRLEQGEAVRTLRRAQHWRRQLFVFLAVLGPGLITSNVDNDAGGIATYSVAGAHFGYLLLWWLVPMTVLLYVSEEMCARMGVVTGKGLSDMIREEFGFRSTFFVMLAGLVVDLGNTVAEFAGVAASMTIFGVSKYVAVPIAALGVWVLVVQGTYRLVEKVFLTACVFYVSYVLSAFLAHPHWSEAIRSTVVPSMHFDVPYLIMLTGLIGTTIAPWQFFYLQAGVVEKRIGPRQYRHCRTDVLIGSVTSMVVVFFIIVCTAATLYVHGSRDITDAGQAAQALAPLAGRWASRLFAFGLLNASLFAASILPLSTAHVICEGLGFEAGIDRKVTDAPMFYGLYTGLIAVGAGIILVPKAPLLKILLISQVANGVWLPVVLIFMLLLINRRDLMGDMTNSRAFNFIGWVSSAVMILVIIFLVYSWIYHWGGVPGLMAIP